MKRATRSKLSGVELKETAKKGDLKGLQEVWATYLEGDVSEKYKVKGGRGGCWVMGTGGEGWDASSSAERGAFALATC